MKMKWVLNNYQIGSKLNTSNTNKIVSKTRIDSKHTEVIFNNLTENEIYFNNRLFAKRGIEV